MKKPPGERYPDGLPNTKEPDLGILKPYPVPHSPNQGMTTTDQATHDQFFIDSRQFYTVIAVFEHHLPQKPSAHSIHVAVNVLGRIRHAGGELQMALGTFAANTCTSESSLKRVLSLMRQARLIEQSHSGGNGKMLTFRLGDAAQGEKWAVAKEIGTQLLMHQTGMNAKESKCGLWADHCPSSKLGLGVHPSIPKELESGQVDLIQDLAIPSESGQADLIQASESGQADLISGKSGQVDLGKYGFKDQERQGEAPNPSESPSSDQEHSVLSALRQECSQVALEQSEPGPDRPTASLAQINNSATVEPADIEQPLSNSSSNELQKGDLVLFNDREYVVSQKLGWDNGQYSLRPTDNGVWASADKSKLKLLKKAQQLNAPD